MEAKMEASRIVGVVAEEALTGDMVLLTTLLDKDKCPVL